MTPDERRQQVEYIVKMAKLGIMIEPAYDREQWRAEQEAADASVERAPKARRVTASQRKTGSHRTA